MMFWYGHGGGAWGWFAMSVGIVLFWALVITVGVLLFRALARSAPSGGEHPRWGSESARWGGESAPHGSGPEQILAERYARGEIEEEEYERRLATLRSSRAGPAQH